MAVSLGNSPIRGPQRRRAPITAEINVTPLVDVMLVLLVIFMVTAPLLTVGVPVNLPKTKASVINEKEEPLIITIDAKGIIYLQETPLEIEVLVPRLMAITQSNAEAPIFVKGDQTIHFGRVMETMGAISSAGFKKVSLLSEVPTSPVAKPRK
jgi:biopolymer transport protein TolR